MALKYSRQREAIKEFLFRKEGLCIPLQTQFIWKCAEISQYQSGYRVRNLTLLADLGDHAGECGRRQRWIISIQTLPFIIILSAGHAAVYRIWISIILANINEMASAGDGEIGGDMTYFMVSAENVSGNSFPEVKRMDKGGSGERETTGQFSDYLMMMV